MIFCKNGIKFKFELEPDDKIILSSWQEFWDDKRKNYE